MSENHTNISRRKFLQAAAAISLAPKIHAVQEKEKTIDKKKILNYHPDMRYRQFRDTNIYFSSISLGGLWLKEPVAHYVIDRGVNLVHMSSTYQGGNSMHELGKVLKQKRDKVYIALKDNFYKGSLTDIDEVLKILNTDYVDFLMFNRHDHSEVADPKITELFQKWQQQGKVRYPGLTSHEDVKACVDAGLKSKMYSLIMPVLSQPNIEVMEEELREAQDNKIGIMAMKTIKGIEDPKLQMAYFKKVLKNPAITTVSKGFKTFEMFDTFLKATQEVLSFEEDTMLYRYAQKNRANNCMMCGTCKRVCPEDMEIPTVLRCKDYYYEQLGDKYTAIQTYDSVSPDKRFNSDCTRCGKCQEVCPNGINISQKLSDANRLFKTQLA
jgi:predicted aldo/keto reductase-like oxidoreductase